MTTHPSLVFLKLCFIALTLCVFSTPGHTAGHTGAPGQGTGKSGTSYVSLAFMLNEFRSIDLPLQVAEGEDFTGSLPRFFPETAQTYGLAFGYGSFIDDYFKVEVRGGTGVRDDTVKGALDVNLAYWLSWYIGYQHPITDYMAGYAMYGVSVFEADETRRQTIVSGNSDNFGSVEDVVVQPNDSLKKGLFGTSFSQTWMLGLEFSLIDHWFLGVEYGRLLKDTDSNLKVRQFGTHLRYQF